MIIVSQPIQLHTLTFPFIYTEMQVFSSFVLCLLFFISSGMLDNVLYYSNNQFFLGISTVRSYLSFLFFLNSHSSILSSFATTSSRINHGLIISFLDIYGITALKAMLHFS